MFHLELLIWSHSGSSLISFRWSFNSYELEHYLTLAFYLPFSAVVPPLEQTATNLIAAENWFWALTPFAPVTDAGWNDVLQAVLPVTADPYHELLNVKLPINQPAVSIPFKVEKVSPVLLLTGPMIVNIVDSSPLTGLSFTVTNLSTSLINILLNMNLPTANYTFQALVTVVG